jgi:hypothetical protein
MEIMYLHYFLAFREDRTPPNRLIRINISAEGVGEGPVSNLGDTFVSELGNRRKRAEPLGVSEKG